MVTAPRSLTPARAVTGAVERLNLDIEHSGVVLGRDSAGQPVLARLFGPQPLSVAFVGGWWAAQILTNRCLAHGAAVVVEAVDTPTPAQHGTMAGLAQWLALDRLTGTGGQGTGRVRAMAGDPAAAWPASVSQPLLRVYDNGPGGPAGRPTLAPWHTQFTVFSQVTPASRQIIATADIVLAQRLDPASATLVGSALLLAPEFVARFGAMDNEMIAAFRGPAVRYTWLNPTPTERATFG